MRTPLIIAVLVIAAAVFFGSRYKESLLHESATRAARAELAADAARHTPEAVAARRAYGDWYRDSMNAATEKRMKSYKRPTVNFDSIYKEGQKPVTITITRTSKPPR